MWVLLVLISGTLGVGGVAYGYDQYQKREEEKERGRAKIAALEKRIADLEQQCRDLVLRLGEKNAEVRKLVKEIERLREELVVAQKSA